MDNWLFWIHMAGTVAFAATAVLAVAPKGIDVFGATVLGIITAVGGGTLRDIILDVPVFWATNQSYIWVAGVASILTFYANSLLTKKVINKLMISCTVSNINTISSAIECCCLTMDVVCTTGC